MTFTIIFLIAFVASFGLRHWLSQRQIRFVAQHRDAVPAEFAEKITLAEHQKAADYTIAKLRLGILENGVSAIILISFTLLGGLEILNIGLLQLLGEGIPQQIALLVSIVLISGVIDIPFSWYKQFYLEERFGFNRMTIKLFFSDMLKGIGVGGAIGIPLLWVILSLMAKAGDFWWLWAWGLWSGFNLLVLFIFPTWIAPFFNKFTPLTDETLASSIRSLADRCGFALNGLFVMDGSKRSAHGNAYFTGFGKARRIVFFDTLLARLTPDEIIAVLAHELGHFKHKHILKRIVFSFAGALSFFAILGWIAQQTWFYTDLGVIPQLGGRNDGMALLLFFMVIPVFTFALTPLFSWFSRKDEFQADQFATQQSSAEQLVSALVKLVDDNASTLTPDPIHSAFYDSHPPASIRIRHLLAS